MPIALIAPIAAAVTAATAVGSGIAKLVSGPSDPRPKWKPPTPGVEPAENLFNTFNGPQQDPNDPNAWNKAPNGMEFPGQRPQPPTFGPPKPPQAPTTDHVGQLASLQQRIAALGTRLGGEPAQLAASLGGDLGPVHTPTPFGGNIGIG